MASLSHHFFRRYLSDGDEIRAVFHRHFFIVLPNLFFWLAVPVCLVAWGIYKWWYPELLTTQFLWLFEAYMFLMFFIMLYKILDWYADVWIITDRGMIDVTWSIMMNDYTFTEFDDISSVHSHQGSIFDKVFNIGDLEIHKMGDEMHISRMYRPEMIAELIQENLHEHHHDDHHAPTSNTNIYIDGVRQGNAVPYKSGFRYMPSPEDDKHFIESVRSKPGTIDLSGGASHDDEEEDHDHGHGHKK